MAHCSPGWARAPRGSLSPSWTPRAQMARCVRRSLWTSWRRSPALSAALAPSRTPKSMAPSRRAPLHCLTDPRHRFALLPQLLLWLSGLNQVDLLMRTPQITTPASPLVKHPAMAPENCLLSLSMSAGEELPDRQPCHRHRSERQSGYWPAGGRSE